MVWRSVAAQSTSIKFVNEMPRNNRGSEFLARRWDVSFPFGCPVEHLSISQEYSSGHKKE